MTNNFPAMGTNDTYGANLRDIMLRQQSIKGFYFPPKPGYQKAAAEVRALEARLSDAAGAAAVP